MSVGKLHPSIAPAVTELLDRCGHSVEAEDALVATIRSECAALRDRDHWAQLARHESEREMARLEAEIAHNEARQRALMRVEFLSAAIAAAAQVWDERQKPSAQIVPLRVVSGGENG